MTEAVKAHDRIFNILFQEDELTWQNIIYDLVRTEEMDAWDIDITEISHKFLERLKKLKEMDFRISGKVVLASSMLLKMKSSRLLDQDMLNFDAILAASEESEEDLLDELEDYNGLENEYKKAELPKIRPRIPQPRKRKVSVFDLVEALEKALEVESRRKHFVEPEARMQAPKKTKDITVIIQDVYDKVISFFSTKTNKKNKAKSLSFSQLIPSQSKEDKVFTFIPLLHLENQRKVNMSQEEHFGEISISLMKQGKIPEAAKVAEEKA